MKRVTEPCKTVTSAVSAIWVSRLIAQSTSPFHAISSLLPVAALTLDNRKLSASYARTGTFIAPMKMGFMIGLSELTLATMILRMLSHIVGTPTTIEGQKALICHL